MLFCSKLCNVDKVFFEELFIGELGRHKKTGGDDKRETKPPSFVERVTVNKQGRLTSLPTKGAGVSI